MICGSDGILAKPTNDNGKIANGSPVDGDDSICKVRKNLKVKTRLSDEDYVR